MDSRVFLSVSLLTTLCALGSAQTPALISPAGATAALGNGTAAVPFAIGALAYQQVHSSSSFSNAQPRVLTQMHFRMAKGNTGQPGPTLDVELHLGTAAVDALSAGATFANNVMLASEVNVLPRQQVNLPNVPDNNWLVGPFPFTAPYVWPASHLSWRMLVWNGPSTSYGIDLWAETAQGGIYGASCGTGASVLVGWVNSFPLSADFMVFRPVFGTNKNVLLLLGLSSTQWAGLALPLSLAPWGAPGCSLYTDVLATVPTVLGANGSAQISLPLQSLQGLVGQTIYSQAMFVDPFANALGIALSNAIQTTFVVPQITQVMAFAQPGATTGTVRPGMGVAVGFN